MNYYDYTIMIKNTQHFCCFEALIFQSLCLYAAPNHLTTLTEYTLQKISTVKVFSSTWHASWYSKFFYKSL